MCVCVHKKKKKKKDCVEINVCKMVFVAGMVLKQKSEVEARGEAAEPAPAGQQLLQSHSHQQQLQHQRLPGHPSAHHTG